MSDLDIKINVDSVVDGIDAMLNGSSRSIRMLRKPMKSDQLDHAKTKKNSDGSPWAPRAAWRVQKRGKHAGKPKRRKGRTRQLLGRLTSPSTWQRTGRTWSAGYRSRADFSGVQQDGGKVGRGSKIPAREFLYFSDKFMDEASEIVGAAMVKSFGGKAL
jgi:phage gpG-like protein